MNTNRKTGTLLLVSVNKRPMIPFIWNEVVNPHIFRIHNKEISEEDFNLYLGKVMQKAYQPIIICDDKPKADDWVYCCGYRRGSEGGFGGPSIIPGGWIAQVKQIGASLLIVNPDPHKDSSVENFSLRHDSEAFKKILVLSNQFSQEFLQLIADGRVKDGDKFDVEMGEFKTQTDDDGMEYGFPINHNDLIKLSKDGTAIIHFNNELSRKERDLIRSIIDEVYGPIRCDRNKIIKVVEKYCNHYKQKT